MSHGETILEKAIEILNTQELSIGIEYKRLDDKFYYLSISVNTSDGGRKTYIFSHEPYSELDSWEIKNLVKRISDIAKYGWTFR